MNSFKEKLNCEDAMFLVSRSLDGDLDGNETLRLDIHIAECSHCQGQLKQTLVIESKLKELNQIYETRTMHEKFKENLQEALSQVQLEKSPPSRTTVLPDEKLIEASRIINFYTLLAIGGGLIPIPIVDMAVMGGLQMKMLSSISEVYKIPFSNNIVKSAIGSLTASALSTMGFGPLGRWIKSIPVIGQTIGTLSISIAGSATTFALGKVFLQHFASGGTFLDFDPEKSREYFYKQFRKAPTPVLSRAFS